MLMGSLFFSSCSHVSRPSHHQIELEKDTWVQVGDKRQLRKKGEILELKDQPILLEAPGHIGLMIAPPLDKTAKYQVNLRPLEEWGGDYFSHLADKVISETLEKVIQAQALLGRGKAQEALEQIKEVQKTYPQATYLKFIEASCLVVLGKKEEARGILELALKNFPDNEEGRKLYISLGGQPFWRDQKGEQKVQ